MIPREAVLLDTCALIWWVSGDLDEKSVERIVLAGVQDAVLVSPVSAWELGLLAAPRRGGPRLSLLPDPQSWFAEAMRRPGVSKADLSMAAAINASLLPEPLHGDPADRLLIATAREINVPIVTRDQEILAYSARGHVQAIAC